MRRKVVKFVFLAFAFLVLTALASVSEAKTIYVPDDYARIQWAVDNASAGDTIIVRDGIYVENIDINKPHLTIRSENGSANCVVQAANSNDHVFYVTADNVTIKGFTVTGATGSDKAGICLHKSNNCRIENVNASNNDEGIYLWSSNNIIINNTAASNNHDGISLYESSNNTIANNNVPNNVEDGIELCYSSNNIIANNTVHSYFGIDLWYSSNNIIANNNASNNKIGIWLHYSSNNTIANNIASSNNDGIDIQYSSNNIIANNNVRENWYGIFLKKSNNNTITNNNASNNRYYGIYFTYSNNNFIANNTFLLNGMFVYNSYNNTVSNNTVNGKPLTYLENVSDYVVEDAGQVIAINSNNITVENLNLSYASVGIEFLKTNNSKIINNNISSNIEGGIFLDNSSNNIIANNSVSLNNWDGIYLSSSSNNTIANNNISSNNDYGIHLSYSSNNIIANNTVSSNNDDGIFLSDSSNNIIANNNISSNNKIGIWLRYSSNNTIANNIVSSNNDGIDIQYSSNNIIANNNVRWNIWDGIILGYSSNNTIANNTVSSNNDDGIFLIDSSSNNTVANNTVSNNRDGIVLWCSSNNIIYLNNFINNTDNVYSYASTNIWNSTHQITYIYNNTTFTNYLGNYWSDYTGSDANGDGIGDTPYSIDSDKDYYPLMRPFEYYFVSEEPRVSISTDKYEYRAGDVMLINITFENPTDEGKSVKFLWRLDIHDYNLSFKVINNKSILLPPEFKKTFVISWRLPKLRASFNASWYVALYDGTISEDTADWRYVCAKKKEEREIAIEMAELREIERSVFLACLREMKG